MSKKRASVRINTVISGEPAEWLQEWKERGIVSSNSDAIRQSFRVFHLCLPQRKLDEKS
jgi:hypothetical protein